MATPPIQSNLNPLESKLQDLIETDKSKMAILVMQAILDANLKYNISLQDIEETLRKKNCCAYLIAKKREFTTKNSLYKGPYKVFHDTTEKTYALMVTTSPEEEAMKKILQESFSYEDNFKKLKNTGFACDLGIFFQDIQAPPPGTWSA